MLSIYLFIIYRLILFLKKICLLTHPALVRMENTIHMYSNPVLVDPLPALSQSTLRIAPLNLIPKAQSYPRTVGKV